MDHNQLRNFLAVCEEKSIVKASAKRFISHQGLSKSLKELESELGLDLFDRSRRGGVMLTEFGEALESAARAYTNQHDYILETMEELKKKGGSKLSIGIFSGFERLFPSSFFSDFLAAYPDISFNIQTMPPDSCQKYVLEQRLQCCLSLPPFDDSRFDAFFLAKKRICVIAGKDHPLAERSSVALRELRGENIIVMNSQALNDITIARLCRRNKLTPKIELNYANWGLITGLCVTSNFISLLPYSPMNQTDTENLRSIAIEDEEVFVEGYLLVNRQAWLNRAAKTFIAYVKNHFAKEG